VARLSAQVNGQLVDVETFDDWASRLDAEHILAGLTYPVPPDLEGVRVVLDVGANVGATTMLFSAWFPDAVVHAFEPVPSTFALLERNTAALANVQAHPFGLLDETIEADIYPGIVGPGQASIHPGPDGGAPSGRIRLVAAAEWVEQADPGTIDVLKVDTEGCEVPILRSLGDHLGSVRLLYLEFHSQLDRRAIEEMIEPTHRLALGRQVLDTGELFYVREDLVDRLRPFVLGHTVLASSAQA
jgi:FkbM family methyltransferase